PGAGEHDCEYQWRLPLRIESRIPVRLVPGHQLLGGCGRLDDPVAFSRQGLRVRGRGSLCVKSGKEKRKVNSKVGLNLPSSFEMASPVESRPLPQVHLNSTDV